MQGRAEKVRKYFCCLGSAKVFLHAIMFCTHRIVDASNGCCAECWLTVLLCFFPPTSPHNRSVVLLPCKHLALCDSCCANPTQLPDPTAAGAAAASAASGGSGGVSAAAAVAAAAAAAGAMWRHNCCPVCGVFVEAHVAGVRLPS